MRTTPLAFLSLMLCTACSSDPADDGNAGSDSTSDSSSTTAVLDAGDAPNPTDGPGTTGSGSTGLDSSSTTAETTTASTGSETTGGMQSLPPTNSAELLPWLEAGEYLDWAAESGPHASAGPHGDVRTFFNDGLVASFEAGATDHPQGAAAVKELYDGGGAPNGWAVMVKVQPDSAGGDGWYWYELAGVDVFADGTGVALCTGCHSGGGTDFVLSPFPLQ